MDVEKLFKKFKKSKSQLNQFCHKQGITQATFSKKARALYPDEWDELIASRKPKSTQYALGLLCRAVSAVKRGSGSCSVGFRFGSLDPV